LVVLAVMLIEMDPFGPRLLIIVYAFLKQMSSHQLVVSGSGDSTNSSTSPSPNRRAPVWKYYEPELVELDGVLKAICKYCGAKLTANRKSGTNSLRTHTAEY
jgi:hypothetical protein